ncbi:tetratricopeptide repeat protein [Streptomyces sp. NPDC047928]|uniref:tetratricopeptide repeat protein n=1 Tax=unclassified Streptomyces TaxID=2593676 RepID=UPI003722A29D
MATGRGAAARPSMQQLIGRRRRAGFVGRGREKALFRDNFDIPVDDERHRFVFHVRGMAGVGKTTLVRELRTTAEGLGAVTAYVDESVNGVPEAMAAIALRFERQGHPLKALDRQLATYRQRRHEAESAVARQEAPSPGLPSPGGPGPGVPPGAPSAGGLAAAQAGLIGVGMIPVVGAFAGAVDPAALAQGADRLRAALGARFGNQEDVQLVLDPLKVLTPVLVSELNRVASGVPWVALFFDTYERTGPFLDTWLRDLITTERYGALPANIVLTLSGQRRLDPACWADCADLVEDLPLEPFTEPETRRLLSAKGIVDEPVVQDVLRLSGGLPVLVSTLAENPGEPNTAGATAVDRFLKWEHDPERRAAALACALPRRLNEDVFAVAAGGAVPGGTAPGEGGADGDAELFGWLRSLPFVSERDDHVRYHDVVRDPMLRLRRTGSPRRWRETHERLAEAFARWRERAGAGLDEPWQDERWRALRDEELYHLLCADPRGGLPAALRDGVEACREGTAVARRWARTIAAAGEDADADPVRRWGAECLDALGDEDRGPVRVLGMLLARAGLDVDGQVGALSARAFHHRAASRYDEAFADCERALALDPDGWRGWFDRALTHRHVRAYDAALADLAMAGERNPDAARVARERGETLRRAGRREEAVSAFDRALALDPADVMALEGRAAAKESLGRTEEAIADANLALDIRPGYRHGLVRRARILRGTGATDAALADLARAEALYPGDPWIVGEVGETYRYAGRYEEAIAAYDRAIALDPEYAWAFGSRAMAEDARGRTDQALADLDRALELKPEYLWALFRRAEILRRRGDTAGRLASLDRAVRKAPDAPVARTMRAQAYGDAGRHDEALADLGRALAIDPDYAFALGVRGRTYEVLGRLDEALADLDRAVDSDRTDWWALTVRARVRHGLGDAEGALSDWRSACVLAPDDANLLTLTGENHRRAGRYEEAVGYFDRAVLLSPDDYWPLGSRGQALRGLGRYAEALTDLDRAAALAPGRAWIVAERGAVLQDTRRYAEALREFDRAVGMEPSSGEAYASRALFHRATGRPAAALADLDRCLELGHDVEWALCERALLHLLAGRHDEALTALDALDGLDGPEGPTGTDRPTGRGGGRAVVLRAQAHRRAGRFDAARREAERLVADDPTGGAFLLAMVVSRTEGLEAAADWWRECDDPLFAACALGDGPRADALTGELLASAPLWDELTEAAQLLGELLRCPGADRARIEPLIRRVEAARDAFPPP